MKKHYKISGTDVGIVFKNVLAFYVESDIDTARGKYDVVLVLIIGTKFGAPSTIRFQLADFRRGVVTTNMSKEEKEIEQEKPWNKGGVMVLYADLISYFSGEEIKSFELVGRKFSL